MESELGALELECRMNFVATLFNCHRYAILRGWRGFCSPAEHYLRHFGGVTGFRADPSTLL